MYKFEKQISISEFVSPFGKLSPNNRWVKIANMIPWSKYEEEYAKQFCDNNGAPAIPFRMALGTLIIKQNTGQSDEDTLLSITENPYMQFLIGLSEFTEEEPFSVASISNFRKYISKDFLNKINDDMFAKNTKDDDDQGDPSNGGPSKENQGELILDATCIPSNIAFPTDINLLNEGREKLESIIDTLHEYTQAKKKPRTYRKKARKEYLAYVKSPRTRNRKVRKVIRKQLSYVRRNLGHIDMQLTEVSQDVLTKKQRQDLETIRILYAQQQEMYDNRSHSIKQRIVSISQPWVRPIVRGKASANVEFGAKVNISLINGYAFVEDLEWEAYNEASRLKDSIERYKNKYGFYPKAVIVDKLYRNRENIRFCKSLGIRITGPALGRPSKKLNDCIKSITLKDASTRNAVEGKFGEGKLKYGLDCIKTKLQGTCETTIVVGFLCMNINKKLRLFAAIFITALKDGILNMIFVKIRHLKLKAGVFS